MKHFNSQQILDDLKNWQSMVKKYQVPNTKEAIIQMANSFSFYVVTPGIKTFSKKPAIFICSFMICSIRS